MEGLLYILTFVCAVLSIAMFFKIWRMTNDVHAIREKLAPKTKAKGKFDDVPATWEDFDRTQTKC